MKNKIFKIIFLILVVFMATNYIACRGDEDNTEDDEIVVTWYKTPNAEPNIVDIIEGEFTISQTDMNRYGYTFLGLYDAPSGGTQVVNEHGVLNINITKSITLYAQWEALQYKIIFEASEDELGTSNKILPYFYDAVLSSFPVPTKEGFVFAGWSNGEGLIYTDGNGLVNAKYNVLNRDFYEVDDNNTIHLYPEYETKKVNVTFDYNDGTYIKETEVYNYGSLLDSTTFPTVDDGTKKIIGWSIDRNGLIEFNGELHDDLTLYAIWQKYKMIDLINEEGDLLEQIIVTDKQEIQLPVLTKQGYVFTGWFNNENYSGFPVNTVSYGSIYDKYYAKFELEKYSITFINNDSSEIINSISYTMEEEVQLPIPGMKENYIFLGWCGNEDLTDTPVMSIEKGTIGNKTLYAKWKGIELLIKFDANGGNFDLLKKYVEYGSISSFQTPTLDGYVFEGWYLGDERITDETGECLEAWKYAESNITLTANYLKKYYITISYSEENLARTILKDYYVAGESVELIVEMLNGDRDVSQIYMGDEFVSNDSPYTFEMPQSDINFRIVFGLKKYNVTFDTAGGALREKTYRVTYLSEFNLPVPFKAGYLFKGWQYNGKLITDEYGNGLEEWNIKEDVEITAIYSIDNDVVNFETISTAEELCNMASDITKTYYLIDDIDMSGILWVPFEFSGNLYGNGYVIKNLIIDSYSEQNIGLFTKLTGNVADVVFENVIISSTSNDESNIKRVGAVCGELIGTIDNVTVLSGNIDCNVAYNGGLVGFSNGGTISNSVNKATISNNSDAVGGIVGFSENGLVVDCINYGAITGVNNVGGIFGQLVLKNESTSSIVSNIKNNLNEGSITGTSNVGGIVGYGISDYSCTVYNCTNKGVITGESRLGGIAGTLENITISNCYNTDTEIVISLNSEGNSYIGGFVGSGSSIYSCANEINITCLGTGMYIGGIAGYLKNATLGSTTNNGIITAKQFTCVGGIVGGYAIDDATINCSIYGSKNNADVYGKKYVGGIAGQIEVIFESDRAYTFNTSSLVNYGRISCTSGYAGGIFGYVYLENSGSSNVSLYGIDFGNYGYILASASFMYTGGLIASFYSDGASTIKSYANTSSAADVYIGKNLTLNKE